MPPMPRSFSRFNNLSLCQMLAQMTSNMTEACIWGVEGAKVLGTKRLNQKQHDVLGNRTRLSQWVDGFLK